MAVRSAQSSLCAKGSVRKRDSIYCVIFWRLQLGPIDESAIREGYLVNVQTFKELVVSCIRILSAELPVTGGNRLWAITSGML